MGERQIAELANGVCLVGRHDVVAALRLLQHEPHRLDVVAGEAPVALALEVAEPQLVGHPELDPRHAVTDLACGELQSTARRLVVEQDPARRVQVVGLAVVHGDPVAVHLGHAVRRTRIEGRVFVLGHLEHLAEHLARARLVVANIRIDDPDGIEDARHAEGGGFTGEDRLRPRRLHERLRREVVDLLRPVLAEDAEHRHFIEQIARHELDAVLDVRDSLEVDGAAAPHHADDLVALGQQQFREVRAVLAGDAGDECTLCHVPVLG